MSKSEVKLYHGAVVCKETRIKGDVTIGSLSVVHPCANIIAEAGPIVIGDGNIIEEQVFIINKNQNDSNTEQQSKTLTIGNNNVFEVGSRIESMSVGDNNVFESKSYVGGGVDIGSGCVIGAGCALTVPERIPDNTLISGARCVRKILLDKPPSQNTQREFLVKMLPNYHHLRKPRQAATQAAQQH